MPAMADAQNEDSPFLVLDRAHDTPVADAIGPQRYVAALQRLADPARVRCGFDAFAQEADDPSPDFGVEFLQLLGRRAGESPRALNNTPLSGRADEINPQGRADVPNRRG